MFGRQTLALLIVLSLLVWMPQRSSAQQYNPCLKHNVMNDDGACWNSLAPIEKIAMVQGIWSGSAIRSLADSLIGQQASYFLDRDWTDLPHETNIGDVVSYFNKFYSVPANRDIDWSWTYLLAAMNARDDDSRDKEALVRFLRIHATLPTFGSIVRVDAPDRVAIETRDKQQFEIHLFGTSSKSMTEEQRERAMAFLQGLTSSGYFGCGKGASPSLFSISYTMNMFQNGMLSASLAIDSSVICHGDQSVALSQLAPLNKIVVNGFMVGAGLVYADPDVDPKWSDAMKNFYRLIFSAESARKKGLYLYGQNTESAVEKVIAFGESSNAPSSTSRVSEGSQPPENPAGPSKVSSGSGFFVSPDIIVTNDHVISGCKKVIIESSEKQTLSATVVGDDQLNDLAALRVSTKVPQSDVVIFGATGSPSEGEKIEVVGFPLTDILASGPSVTTGVVSNLSGPGDDSRLLQITAPVQPGNSGGPVFDEHGYIVGVVAAKLDAAKVTQLTGAIPENVNFAINGSILRTFLDANQVKYVTGSVGLFSSTRPGDPQKAAVHITCYE